ncbi:MAG: DUF362 domain-containing protein [Chitinivibrionales bacterium]|nr:DUF362 domain-containing protein [Chitinivibrionales bacterium]
MKTDRRQFIKASAAGTAALAAGAYAESTEKNAAKSEVFVGKGKPEDMLPRIVDKMGGIGRFVKPGSRVLIKPNMSFANPPEWATTTSPAVVKTMVQLCVDAGAKRVIVCDNTLRDPELCKQKTGIADALKDIKQAVVFIPKQDNLFTAKSSDKATALRNTMVVRELERAGTFISLPVTKSHSAAGVSLGLKGMMGLVKDRGAMHREMDLHTAIAELLYYMRPDLAIVDAGRALLDNGPGGPGKVVELNTYVGGTDPVAVDSYAVTLASWYGKTFEGKQVQHIKIAGELGFGNVESSMIQEVTV